MRLASMALVGCALAASWLAVACGSSNGSPAAPGNDAGQTVETSVAEDTGSPVMKDAGPVEEAAIADTGTGYPAFIPNDVPQVADAGGPVMASPKVVPIFYAVDDPTTVASVEDFLSKLNGSMYWNAWAPEYGVGNITALTPIMLTDPLTAYWDDSQIQAFLTNALQTNDPTFPAPDGNTIYAFFFPANVTITTTGVPLGDGGTDAGVPDPNAESCTAFGGYHDNITLSNNMNVAYAVVPRCPSFGNLMGIDAITGPASHELAEASSDPFPSSNPAYSTVDAPHSYWSRLLGGGEVGDMCAQLDSSFTKFPSLAYTVQRIWSNKAAVAGTDPCVPLPAGDLNYNSYPNMPDMITYSSRGATVTSKGVEIPVGSSKVVELDLASSSSTMPWSVQFIDSNDIGNAGNPLLSAAFMECNGAATCMGNNGDKLHMVITVMTAGRRGTEPFLIESSQSASSYTLWAGLVGSETDAGGGGFPPFDAGGGG